MAAQEGGRILDFESSRSRLDQIYICMKTTVGLSRVLAGSAILAVVTVVGFALRDSGSRVASMPRDNATKESNINGAAAETVKVGAVIPAVAIDRIGRASIRGLHDLLTGLSTAEIAAVAERLDSLETGGLSDGKITLFFKAWCQLDPRTALESALAFKNNWARDVALQAVFDGADGPAAKLLLNALQQSPNNGSDTSLRRNLFAKGIVKLSEVDGNAAAEFLDSKPVPGLPVDAWKQVADRWAATNPIAAMDWARQQEFQYRRAAMQGMINGWWQSDPNAATSYAAEQANISFEGQQLAGLVATKIAENDPQKAASWVGSLPNPDARELAAVPLAVTWATKDPQSAGQWAASLPVDQAIAVVPPIAGVWSRSDPQGALGWINSMNGEVRDASIATYTAAVASTNPQSGMQWALGISDPSVRDQVAKKVAQSWLTQDPQTAASWIQSSGLSASDKARLLSNGR